MFLTCFCLICWLLVHGIQWKLGVSWNSEVGNCQRLHLFFSIHFGLALKLNESKLLVISLAIKVPTRFNIFITKDKVLLHQLMTK